MCATTLLTLWFWPFAVLQVYPETIKFHLRMNGFFFFFLNWQMAMAAFVKSKIQQISHALLGHLHKQQQTI